MRICFYDRLNRSLITCKGIFYLKDIQQHYDLGIQYLNNTFRIFYKICSTNYVYMHEKRIFCRVSIGLL